MAIDLKEIIAAMGGEIVERSVHQQLSEHLREEIAKGASSHDIVAQAIIRLRNSEFLSVMRGILGPRMLGLTLTGLGAGIAKVLQTMGPEKFASILPEDQSATMREVRFILQSLAPSLIVGAIDGATDSWKSDVHAAVAKVRSDDRAPVPQKAGRLDQVAFVNPNASEPAKVFVCEFETAADGTKTVRFDSLGLPCCEGAEYQRLKQARIASVSRTKEKKIPGGKLKDGKDAPSKIVEEEILEDEYKKLCQRALNVEILPIDVAFARLGTVPGIDPETINKLLKQVTPKDPPPAKKEGFDALHEKGSAFTFIISRTLAVLAEHEQRYLRDFIQDIARNANYINLLGEEFVGKEDADGRFKQEDIDAIVQHVQTWMGATLTFENKIRQALARAKHVLEGTAGVTTTVGTRVETAIGEVAGAAGKIALASLFSLTTLFALFLTLVILGAFGVNLDRPLAVSWVNGLYFIPAIVFAGLVVGFEKWLRFLFVVLTIMTGIPAVIFLLADAMGRLAPNEFAIGLVLGGGFLAIIELHLFTVIQGLLSLVTRFFPGMHKDWLVNKGRVLIMFIGIHVGIFIILLTVKTPLLLRLLMCVPTLIAIASQMGLTGYEFNEEARQRAGKTMRLFKTLSVIVFIATVAVIFSQHAGASFGALWLHVKGSHITQFILWIVIGGPIFALAARWLHIKERVKTNGIVTETTLRPPNKWIWGGAVLLLFVLATWTWTGEYVDEFFEKKAPSNPLTSWITHAMTPASQPVTPPAPASGQAIAAPAPVSGIRAVRRKGAKSDTSGSELLSPRAQQALQGE